MAHVIQFGMSSQILHDPNTPTHTLAVSQPIEILILHVSSPTRSYVCIAFHGTTLDANFDCKAANVAVDGIQTHDLRTWVNVVTFASSMYG